MVGGISFLIIDGKTRYFGFSERDDLVLSPFIDSPRDMAAFAARNMRQTDGAHREDDWAELVEATISEADPDDIASRTIRTAHLRRVADQLHLAEKQNRPIPGLAISYQLLYLLEASKGDVQPFPPSDEAKRLGFDIAESPMQAALKSFAFLDGSSKLPTGASYRDAAVVARLALDSLASNGPGNWPDTFKMLRIGR